MNDSRPLRLCIVGSGPAAFYAAEHALKQTAPRFEVDMLDRLPTPYGLVRGGVAPDHQKIKSVIAVYEKVAALPGFRFYGNVEFGKHVTLADLESHFDAILFATGAQTDRRLGIPGEDLAGSHSATEFVAWYNGHPDFRDRAFDLTQQRAAVIGVGNVAIDVARILCHPETVLSRTDMADAAISALAKAQVRDVWILGRRGPVQAAFTNNEVKELGELPETDVIVRPDEVVLDPISQEELAASGRSAHQAKVEILQGFSQRAPEGRPRRLHLRFFVSPLEILGDERGHVRALRLAKNRLERDAAGRVNAVPTGEEETLEVGLVFRSVGYRGVALPGVPYDAKGGVIPNQKGHVLGADGAAVRGLYVSGWIKRGPSGVIGNNKADSVETMNTLLADAGAGALLQPANPSAQAFEALLCSRQKHLVTFGQWKRLDKIECERGAPAGRPRVKMTSVEEMLDALGGK